MTTESLPEHIRRPHMRPIQPFGVTKDGKQFVALRDPAMLVKETMVVPPVALQALQHFQGEQDLDELAKMFDAPLGHLIALSEALDKVGLLWGPTFDRMEDEVRQKLDKHGAFPSGADVALGKDEAECRRTMDEWLQQTEDPEIEGVVCGILAPHLDYQRGWPNYAAAYRCIDPAASPDRVVILGTNHFGLGDGVVLTEYAFETPLGRVTIDDAAVEQMSTRLGREATIDQLDHMAEHSIRLQLPWIKHCIGEVPIIAALIPDPLVPMVEDDQDRTSLEDFVGTMIEVLGELGGETFFVASSDLSHVGPQFGEPRAIDDQRRQDVERHDREMMGKFCTGDPEEFLSAMKWCNNPTRWCSVGNMSAALMLTKPGSVELIDYRQACDEKGNLMVTSAAMAMLSA